MEVRKLGATRMISRLKYLSIIMGFLRLPLSSNRIHILSYHQRIASENRAKEVSCLKYTFNLFVVLNLFFLGCASHMGVNIDVLEDCTEKLDQQIESAPIQLYLITLDGQRVQLDEFFNRCQIKMPFCTLPEKFYHWKNEVKTVTSKTNSGEISHKVRIYFNYLSTCDPNLIDSKKTHGDVAEFYDGKGTFMGLIVHVDNGIYCPLPYSKYSGKSNEMSICINNNCL